MNVNQQTLDIEGMCCTARNAIHIAVELAGDDAKDALMLRSARYNLAHGLPLSSAQEVAIHLAKCDVGVRELCERICIPPLLPVLDIDPTIDITNWEPTDPTKWTARFFDWDEGRVHA